MAMGNVTAMMTAAGLGTEYERVENSHMAMPAPSGMAMFSSSTIVYSKAPVTVPSTDKKNMEFSTSLPWYPCSPWPRRRR